MVGLTPAGALLLFLAATLLQTAGDEAAAIVEPGGNFTRATSCIAAVSRILTTAANSESVPAPCGMKLGTTSRDSSGVIATNAGSRTTATCPICLGLDRFLVPCPTCGDHGEVVIRERLNIALPGALRDGDILIVKESFF